MEDVILSYRLCAEGDKLLGEGKDYPALLKYLKASEVNPFNEAIFGKLAMTFARAQQFSRAMEATKRAIGLNPDYPFAYNTQGIIFLARGEYSKAILSFKKAIDLNPGVASFYANLGTAYIQLSRFDEWRDAYRKAVEIDPQVFSGSEGIQLSYQTGSKPVRAFTSERLYQLGAVLRSARE